MSVRARRAIPCPATVVAVALSFSFALGCGQAQSTTSTVTAVSSVTEGATPRVLDTGRRPATTSSGATSAAATTSNAAAAVVVPKPHVIWDPIPFGAERKTQMTAYARRHYGSFMTPTYKLIHPHVVVIHYTQSPTFQSTFNTFAPDTADPELHELPNTCAHFVVDKSGGIHQLVPLDIMCRHAVGLNWTAIGIEHVGNSDQEVLNDRAQVRASLQLARWLRCKYHVTVRDVIGHNESLSSPYHREDVASLRTQTHSDFSHADMEVYRRDLLAAGGCA
jgi:N-acetylmuramoyl-L-alanine amidase